LALKILHLEDDENDAELVRLAMQRDGLDCVVHHVASRQDFARVLAEGPVDVIVSDVNLPGYGGLYAMADAQRWHPDTPFVFLSGTAGEELVVECLKAGATDFVLKSQMSRLGPAVRRALKEAEDRIARRQAEAVLADSLRFTQSIIDASPSLVYVYDSQQGRNLFVNHEGLRTLGYTPAQLLAMGPNLLERLMHPEDVEASRRARDRFREAPPGEVIEVEFRLRAARGAWRWFCTREVAFESGGGRGGQQVLGTAQDVTTTKLAERRRAAQYAVTRVLAEAVPWQEAVPRVLEALREHLGGAVAEIWIVDDAAGLLRFGGAAAVDGPRAVAWREASRDLTYVPGAGLPGRIWQTAAPQWGSELATEVEPERQALLGDAASAAVVAVPARSGDKANAVLVMFGMPPGEDDVDLLAMLDATGHQLGEFRERQKVEERMREQAALIDHAREAIVVTDLDLRVTFWNRSAERLYGFSSHEAIGGSAHELFGWPLDSSRNEALLRVLSAGEWTAAVENTSRDGAALKIQSHWTLVRDAKGMPRSILIINTDVTDAKRLEAELLRAQRLDSLGVLAGGIAHDLNNVLAPILMSLDALRRRATDERSMHMFQLLEASASRGADLVRQVLAFARSSEGPRTLLEPVRLVQDLEAMLRDAIPSSVRLALDVPDGLWYLRGEATQLHQVLLNLCVNARDAMPTGGLITVSARNAEVDASFAGMNAEARPGPHVVFKVTDTGSGIAPDIRERIFEPFFTTKEGGRTTGLGLSTTMTIIRGHHGFISVATEPGKGSTFSVYLPATLSVERLAEEEARRAEYQGRGQLIIVADDEGAIREITKETLEASGYSVLTAADGAEAVGICASHPNVAAVVMDVHMPVMDGPAASRAMLRINPAIRVIAVSGHAARETNAMKAGARHFLAKPYTAEQVLAALHDALTP
jgi:PAS domain S-box-containing protein